MAGDKKTYLIISPQVWGDIYISKHNYALELAAMGHKVYYLNPPTYVSELGSIKLSVSEKTNNLFLVNYTLPNLIHRLRFKARPAYDLIIRKSLIKQLNALAFFDEVWCFEPNIFSGFQAFNAGKKLLFLVDHFENNNLKKLAATADGIATVSQVILDFFAFSSKPKMLMNHGLNNLFAGKARETLAAPIIYHQGQPIKVAYVGNLLMGNRIDFRTIQKIVETHPQIQFHFYGPYVEKNNTLGSNVNDDVRKFISYLKSAAHVTLHGPVGQNELANTLQTVDAFLISYDYLNDVNKASNCHKIIEYLSTGKVVISNRIMSYEGTTGLLEMPNEVTNENLPALFHKVITNLQEFNSPEAQTTRIKFALQNTYRHHIKTLSHFINQDEEVVA